MLINIHQFPTSNENNFIHYYTVILSLLHLKKIISFPLYPWIMDPLYPLPWSHGIMDPTPNTLHPIPYTLHPTPNTQHTTPYTLHPTPYTQHPTPYTRHPTHPPNGTIQSSTELCPNPCLPSLPIPYGEIGYITGNR